MQNYIGKIRVFPYYKGEYIGKDMFGFSSIYNAWKFAKTYIPKEEIYKKFYSSEDSYNRTHTIFYYLSKKKYTRPYYDPNNTNKQIYSFGKTFNSSGLSDETYNEYITAINNNNIRDAYNEERIDNVIKFQEKYKIFPLYKIDYRDFYKVRELYIQNNVEFKIGKIKNIIVECEY